MKRLLLISAVSILFYNPCCIYADNTAGSMLHSDATKFNHPYLIQLTWAAEIYEYEYNQANYRYRIEFNSVNFMGRGPSTYPYCSVGAMIQNSGHSFVNDVVGNRFGYSPNLTDFPGLGFYFSSLQSTWGDSSHGVQLNTNPDIFPQFARVFENVDNMGYSAKNIYTRQNVGTPSQNVPITVRWTVIKKGIVTNPDGHYSKNMSGDWVALRGTFVIWNFTIEINGIVYDVADYYLPIANAEYIMAWDPLTLHQEYFGAKEGILNSEKGTVRYVDIKASDGIKWYNLDNWDITWRIDDGGGNLDNRFGWLSDGKSLTSCVGHENDVANCYRNPGKTFNIELPTNVSCYTSILFDDFMLYQNFPNPFNPVTTINYSIPKSQFVTLKVFDLLGKEITILLNEEQSPGSHTAKFDGSNLSSGVYFYRMQAGDFVQTKKSLLLK